MAFENDFYEQWKLKSTNNHRLLIENPDLPIEKLNSEKIFSSTALDDQIESQTFSLRLSSESYVDETPEILNSKPQINKNEVIVINDSTSDESIFSFDKANKVINTVNDKHRRRGMYILESSDDESSAAPKPVSTKNEVDNITTRTFNDKNKNKEVIIEESDTEIEESRVPEMIRETVSESVTLSERKKKEILQWLATNLDVSRSGSSCSQESAISTSRKGSISSGNSSLERFEMKYETPNNRGKLSKPGTGEKSNKRNQTLDRQNTIDQYFSNSKKGQLNIIRTPGSKCSDKTPTGDRKVSSKRVLIPETKSFDIRTPRSTSSDKTITNKKINSRRVLIPETQSFDSKTSKSTNSDKKLLNNKKETPKKITIPESESFESNEIPDTLEGQNDLYYTIKTPSNKLLTQKSSVIIPESIETSDEIISSPNSPDLNSNNINNKQNNPTSTNNITINTTINDCADILENLYGPTWRNKATTLISATEPRKQPTKKIIQDVQTEKKITFRKPVYNNDRDNEFLYEENDGDLKTKRCQITAKKSKNKHKTKDSFINDETTTDSSPDCSYYTALTNPIPPQNNQITLRTASTIKKNNKNTETKKLHIYDSDTDDDKLQNKAKDWKNHQKKLSFDSSSSSLTSEFDPEDVVPPRPITKDLKIKKPDNLQSAKPKIIQIEKPFQRKSFLASLCGSVPLDEADFKAMTYRVKYDSLKEELCKLLYKLFNEKVFDNQLPKDMPIEWSSRLRGTAGKCFNKQSLKALGNTVRSSRIVLATKILDSPDRLRDTLIHEMCHAATWLINNVSDGHGSFWKAWAAKAMKIFPELPSISRCHNYEIQTKYTYKCTSCGYSIGRHSKSLDLNRKRCGYCHGKFELLINKVTKAGKVQMKSTAQTKKPSGFALYVKENYHTVKQSGAKHGEVMKILGQQFSAVKITPKPEDRIRNNEDESP